MVTDNLASSVRSRHSTGVRNTKVNLTGLAILAKNEARVTDRKTLFTIPWCLGKVPWHTVRYVVGRLKTTTGNTLATNRLFPGLLVKQCDRLFAIMVLAVGLAKSLKTNYVTPPRTRRRLAMTSKWPNMLNMNVLKSLSLTTNVLKSPTFRRTGG